MKDLIDENNNINNVISSEREIDKKSTSKNIKNKNVEKKNVI